VSRAAKKVGLLGSGGLSRPIAVVIPIVIAIPSDEDSDDDEDDDGE
jgi:hypothetical protein